MTLTGLLILSNIKNIKTSLCAIQKYVNNLYIHVNIPKTTEFDKLTPPVWCNLVTKIYSDCVHTNPDMDVRVLVNPLKNLTSTKNPQTKDIQLLFSDENYPEICENIKNLYKIKAQPIILNECDDNNGLAEIDLGTLTKDNLKLYKTVVLGGTFDRIHLGHKILLTEAVLRATKKLIVGVTDNQMIKSKTLYELILPVENRIHDVENFLTEIDYSLEYEIVSINDPFGPTKSDPDIDMIIVSSETFKGAEKVNELRIKNGLKTLEICCINLVKNIENNLSKYQENKISSSNKRMDFLGTRIRAPEPRPNLPKTPYIIGLTGSIASGKSKMAERFAAMGAEIMDCDKIAHELYAPGQVCYQKIIDHFGESILDSNMAINRTELGKIVFGNPKELEILNGIVWPEILIEVKRRIDKLCKNGTRKIDVVIIEAAVLLKAGWETECHEIWSMIVPSTEAICRIQQRNNLSEEDAKKRIASQMDNKSIVEKSNVIFSSEWSFDYTQIQAEKAWNMVLKEIHS